MIPPITTEPPVVPPVNPPVNPPVVPPVNPPITTQPPITTSVPPITTQPPEYVPIPHTGLDSPFPDYIAPLAVGAGIGAAAGIAGLALHNRDKYDDEEKENKE